MNYAQALMDQGKYKSARKLMKDYLKLVPGHAASLQAILKTYEKEIAAEPKNLDLYLACVKFCLNHQMFSLAEQVLGQAEKINPEDIDLLFQRSRIQLIKGNWAKAGGLLEKVLEKNPEHEAALKALAELKKRDLYDRDAGGNGEQP